MYIHGCESSDAVKCNSSGFGGVGLAKMTSGTHTPLEGVHGIFVWRILRKIEGCRSVTFVCTHT